MPVNGVLGFVQSTASAVEVISRGVIFDTGKGRVVNVSVNCTDSPPEVTADIPIEYVVPLVNSVSEILAFVIFDA